MRAIRNPGFRVLFLATALGPLILAASAARGDHDAPRTVEAWVAGSVASVRIAPPSGSGETLFALDASTAEVRVDYGEGASALAFRARLGPLVAYDDRDENGEANVSEEVNRYALGGGNEGTPELLALAPGWRAAVTWNMDENATVTLELDASGVADGGKGPAQVALRLLTADLSGDSADLVTLEARLTFAASYTATILQGDLLGLDLENGTSEARWGWSNKADVDGSTALVSLRSDAVPSPPDESTRLLTLTYGTAEDLEHEAIVGPVLTHVVSPSGGEPGPGGSGVRDLGTAEPPGASPEARATGLAAGAGVAAVAAGLLRWRFGRLHRGR